MFHNLQEMYKHKKIHKQFFSSFYAPCRLIISKINIESVLKTTFQRKTKLSKSVESFGNLNLKKQFTYLQFSVAVQVAPIVILIDVRVTHYII